ncbi:MAG TPA: phosphoribosylformylglycinamidine synthase, partial [Bacteroidales bacterium]|nr:phosphoribosylformylglycinamidine synthase [Bacteroidales bacterium]
MITFFEGHDKQIFAVQSNSPLSETTSSKLTWLFSEATLVNKDVLTGYFVGPRKEMITPWSTNAVEITQNMGIAGIIRIEEFFPVASKTARFDPMLQRFYENLDQDTFTINRKPEPILYIEDIAAYNAKEGLALSSEEIDYLNSLTKKI